ncbi:peptidylprolyl isomerase [cf. Phormidesmis sp. LEGE 11477]|uniref:peptidylprolyl isomerase n=1 Tax=cf. Phormidesmis sp. LEGE 11477 TaxID=1828680 RepID=UPI0018830D3D|nr:peptidylprolyl isomerase [cf. Phormidesmis sp. LEGE 11477]MBE9064274.1 peptidylprolyl isomerase [cf. Phormidesmis sp. LEGE 11477]
MNAALQIGTKSIDTPTLVQKLLQYRLLETFVKETIVDELIEGVSCDPAVAFAQFCQQRKLQTEEQQQAWCQQAHLTPEQMRLEAIREMRLVLFKEQTWGDRLQTFFLERKGQFDRVVYSLIRTKNKELAQELYFRLCDDGASFADIARQYSEGKEAQTGGLVGPIEMSVPHPILARMLQLSEEGQLWEPAKIGDWMIIVRCEKLIPAQLDEPMRQRLLQDQFQTLLNQRMQASPVKLLPKVQTQQVETQQIQAQSAPVLQVPAPQAPAQSQLNISIAKDQPSVTPKVVPTTVPETIASNVVEAGAVSA